MNCAVFKMISFNDFELICLALCLLQNVLYCLQILHNSILQTGRVVKYNKFDIKLLGLSYQIQSNDIMLIFNVLLAF